MREILPYPSTLVGYPIPLLSSSYPDTFKRKHDKPSYYLKFSANPLREHVKFLSRHTRWVAGSYALAAYRFSQSESGPGGPQAGVGARCGNGLFPLINLPNFILASLS